MRILSPWKHTEQMGNKKSKLSGNESLKVARDCSQTGRDSDSNRRRTSEIRPYKIWFSIHQSEPIHDLDEDLVRDILDQQRKREVGKVLAAIKSVDYNRFCKLLKSKPFIQHWRVFEEAVDMDFVFYIPNRKRELTPKHRSFTLRLMDSGYQITERELELMEMRLYSKLKFRILKNCIMDYYLSRMGTLQELCRRSLKKAYRDGDYVRFVKSLTYPETLKDFLLTVS